MRKYIFMLFCVYFKNRCDVVLPGILNRLVQLTTNTHPGWTLTFFSQVTLMIRTKINKIPDDSVSLLLSRSRYHICSLSLYLFVISFLLRLIRNFYHAQFILSSYSIYYQKCQRLIPKIIKLVCNIYVLKANINQKVIPKIILILLTLMARTSNIYIRQERIYPIIYKYITPIILENTKIKILYCLY